VILRTRYGGDLKLEKRSNWPDYTYPPPRSAGYAGSGVAVTNEAAFGLTALGRAIRLVASVAASVCLEVWEGEHAEKTERDDTYPGPLFERPVEGMSAFDWRYDIFASLEACENALLWKRKDNKGRVVELVPLPVDHFTIRVDRNGDKVFEIVNQGTIKSYSTDQILHVRGHTPKGGLVGVSRIMQHRDPLGSMLAAQRFEGSYFRNHARPDLAAIFPAGVTQEQAAEWRPIWDAEYGGPDNAGKVIPMGGGATLVPIPVSMADVQFLEQKKLSVNEVGRIMDVDPTLLGADAMRPGEKAEALQFFMALQMTPRFRRVEEAFLADPDLFDAGGELYPEFARTDLMFLDAKTKAEVYHYGIQDGTSLPDEVRAEQGKPPLPDGAGKIPQITPVGGAPNPTSDAGPLGEPAQNSLPTQTVEVRNVIDTEPLAAELREARQNDGTVSEKLLSTVTDLVAHLESRHLVADHKHEQRDMNRQNRERELLDATVEALRAVSAPNIVVNVDPTPVTVENVVHVDPTPVTIENVVNVPETPVQLTLMEPEQHSTKTVTFERNPRGQITAATVEED
jgi:HK97 family phage portal protein